RTCTCSSGWRSWRGARAVEASRRCDSGLAAAGGGRDAVGASFVEGVAQPLDPVIGLHCGAAHNAARPNELERTELPPGLVVLENGAGDEVAGHGRGVEPVAAKPARQPHVMAEFADLRHAV